MPNVFIGSTYRDLSEHRLQARLILEAQRFHPIGMEDFAARAAQPVSVCLNEVRQSHVYVGIFGMRYGELVPGFAQSFIHFEYNEARKIGMPLLVFLMDEDRHPIYAKDVDVGERGVMLSSLKEELRNEHTFSAFESAEHLANQVKHSMEHLLKDFGTIERLEEVRNRSMLKLFNDNPEEYVKCNVEIVFRLRDIETVTAAEAAAIGLAQHSAIKCFAQTQTGPKFWVYAAKEISETLHSTVEDSFIRISGVTRFDPYDGERVKAIVAKAVLGVTPPI